MTRHVALLRGINVGGHRPVPMAELRALCGSLGYTEVATYIQSGNLVFSADHDVVEQALEAAIAERFGFPVDVIARTAAEWPVYLAQNPFREASAAEPNRVMLLLAKRPPDRGAVTALRARAADERIAGSDEAIWIHYPSGQNTTKLSPSLVDRLVGSPVTARNWRTVQVLAGMLAAP